MCYLKGSMMGVRVMKIFYSLDSLTMLRQMRSTAVCKTTKKSNFLSPVFCTLPFSDSWWTSIVLPELHVDLSRSYSHHCHLQAESCVSAKLRNFCVLGGLSIFHRNFSFAGFQITTLCRVSHHFTPKLPTSKQM